MNIKDTNTNTAIIDTPRLQYFGGKILKHPSFVSVYAGSYWVSEKGTQDRDSLDQCSKTATTGSYASLWKEYGIDKGKFSGSTTIPLLSNRRTVDESAIQQLVASAISRGGVKKPDGETVYTIFLPPGITLAADDVDSRHGLGGFHGSYLDNGSGKRVYYAALAYAEGSNGIPFTNSSVDNISIAASHEWTEAVTDPNVNAGKLGWYDKRFGEVGDIPFKLGLRLSDLWGRVGGCAVQKEWSNVASKPVLPRSKS